MSGRFPTIGVQDHDLAQYREDAFSHVVMKPILSSTLAFVPHIGQLFFESLVSLLLRLTLRKSFSSQMTQSPYVRLNSDPSLSVFTSVFSASMHADMDNTFLIDLFSTIFRISCDVIILPPLCSWIYKWRTKSRLSSFRPCCFTAYHDHARSTFSITPGSQVLSLDCPMSVAQSHRDTPPHMLMSLNCWLRFLPGLVPLSHLSLRGVAPLQIVDLRCQLDPPSPVWSPCSSQVIWIPTWHASIHIWILPTWLVLGWFLYLSKHFGSLHVHWYHSIVIVVLCSVPIALWLFFLPVVLRGTEHTHGGHMHVGSCALCASLSRPI
jgi:hypothetical protein